jgi:hypothetical protein
MSYLIAKIKQIQSNGKNFKIILYDSRFIIVNEWCEKCKVNYAIGFHKH